MIRSIFHLLLGLTGLAAAALYVPIAAVIAVVALPLAAIADTLASWTIRLLSRDSPSFTFAAPSSIDFPAPQTGRPEITAFA